MIIDSKSKFLECLLLEIYLKNSISFKYHNFLLEAYEHLDFTSDDLQNSLKLCIARAKEENDLTTKNILEKLNEELLNVGVLFEYINNYNGNLAYESTGIIAGDYDIRTKICYMAINNTFIQQIQGCNVTQVAKDMITTINHEKKNTCSSNK